MRRFITLLSLLVFMALFISCAQSVKQNGSINLDGRKIVSRAVQYSMEKSRAPETGDDKEEITSEMEEALKAALDFKATLSMEIKSADNSYHDSAEEDYNVDYYSGAALEKKTITFTDVPVGIKATITAKITTKLTIKDQTALTKLFELMDMPAELADLADDLLIENLSTELNWGYTLYGKSELTVHEGENPVTMKMSSDPKIIEGGEGGGEEGGDDEGIEITGSVETELPQTLTIKINSEKTASKFFLNKGDIVFMLLDEEGNDIAAVNETTAGANWEYKLYYGNTEIPETSANSETYYSHAPGKIVLENLPVSGNYHLYVQAKPIASGYDNCDMVSATFEIEVPNTTYYEYAAGNVLDASGVVSDGFNNLLGSITTDAYIKIKGEVSVNYGDYYGLFMPIKDSLTGFQHLVDFDFSETTTTNSEKFAVGAEFQNCSKLRSITLPDDLTQIGYTTFTECTNLEKIVFGTGIQIIGGLDQCPKLTSVIIPETASMTYISSGTFTGDTLLKELSLPASFVALGDNALGSIENLILADESGTWYYTTNMDTFASWTRADNPVTPPSDTPTLDSIIIGLGADAEININSPNSKKLLYADQNTDPNEEYYFYCVK